MTATAGDLRARPSLPDPTAADLEQATLMVRRAHLRMQSGRRLNQAIAPLARALAAWPLHTAHGQLLDRATRRRSRPARRAGPRPEPERAARRILECATTPTPAAVAHELAGQAAAAARAARIAPLVDRDGATVARFVADWRRRYGRDPTRGKVIHRMRREWRASDGEAVVTAMLAAGWLVATRTPGSQPPCGLAPGPRAEPAGRPIMAEDPS